METTINYQNKDIDVEVIDEDNTVLGKGTDSILRDDAGRYYFARHREPEDGGFAAVHRVNINAVLLRAASIFNDPVTVRTDAADLLMAARVGDYTDPWPADSYHEIKAARGDQRAAEWVAKILGGEDVLRPTPSATPDEVPFAGPYELTLNLSKAQWGMLRQAARHDGDSMEQWAIDMLSRNVATLLGDFYGHDEQRAEEAWDNSNLSRTEKAEEPEGLTIRIPDLVKGEPFTEIELSAEATALVEQVAEVNGLDFGQAFNEVIRFGMNLPETRASFEQMALSHRHHAHDPADVALLAAAKPEAVEDDEPIIEEEHVEDEDDDTTATQDGKEGQ